jgi:hypothetical protein
MQAGRVKGSGTCSVEWLPLCLVMLRATQARFAAVFVTAQWDLAGQEKREARGARLICHSRD